jgi:hypothetical protein
MIMVKEDGAHPVILSGDAARWCPKYGWREQHWRPDQMQIDPDDEEFLERFWIAYWQGRYLLQHAFPPDGGQEDER